jgi:serine/threonine protein kinase
VESLGTGTFGRVVIALCTEKNGKSSYYAIKILSINDVIKKKQVLHVKSEKNILLEITHPFVINM